MEASRKSISFDANNSSLFLSKWKANPLNMSVSIDASPFEEATPMLDAKAKVRDSEKTILILENRIKRMKFEEERAKKKMEEANKKVKEVMQVRDRLQKEKEDRVLLKIKEKEEVEYCKSKNFQERYERKSVITKNFEEIKRQKQETRFGIVERSQKHLEVVQINKMVEVKKKQRLRESMQIEQRAAVQQVMRSMVSRSLETKSRFKERVEERHRFAEEKLNQIKVLEKEEGHMLASLQMTFIQQEQSLKSLEKVLNEGIAGQANRTFFSSSALPSMYRLKTAIVPEDQLVGKGDSSASSPLAKTKMVIEKHVGTTQKEVKIKLEASKTNTPKAITPKAGTPKAENSKVEEKSTVMHAQKGNLYLTQIDSQRSVSEKDPGSPAKSLAAEKDPNSHNKTLTEAEEKSHEINSQEAGNSVTIE